MWIQKGFQYAVCFIVSYRTLVKIFDEKGFGEACLMDFSKAFNTLNHELLIAELTVYGFNNESLKLIRSYLTNRQQRTKINKSFSRWTELLQGIPQGSVLGLLVFNIYLNDLFFLVNYTEVFNFADDTTFFAYNKDLGSLINRLEHDSFLAIEWFQNNYMKLNEDKYHLLDVEYKNESIWPKMVMRKFGSLINTSYWGYIQIEHYPLMSTFQIYVNKAGKKVSALARLSSYMTLTQRRFLTKSFIEAHFDYCPLVWMFHSRVLNRKISHLRKCSLRTVYKESISSIHELLQKDHSFTSHHKNIESLAIELYKIKENLSNEITSSIFPPTLIKYNLPTQSDFFQKFCKYQQIWSKFNKIFRFKGLPNGSNGNEKFEEF